MLLLDNSAWSRIVSAALPPDRAETVAGWMERSRLATCLPFLLEAGFSARTHAHHVSMMAQLNLFERLPLTAAAEVRALKLRIGSLRSATTAWRRSTS